MNKISLADTGILISPLGLGTVKLGRNQGVKYPQPFSIPDDRQANDLLNTARELGINLIDTAPAYGCSEERLGKLLQGQRQDWVICTKVGEEFNDDASSYHFDETHTRKSIARSLQRLNTDYLDIVLVHSNGDDVAIIEQQGILAVLADLKRQGVIRAFGMSTKTVEGGLLAAANSDLVMVTYNPVCTEDATVLDYCRDNNKGALIKKAFDSGKLCQAGEDPVRTAMNFIFRHHGVSSVIVGTINPAHLRSNVLAVQSVL